MLMDLRINISRILLGFHCRLSDISFLCQIHKFQLRMSNHFFFISKNGTLFLEQFILFGLIFSSKTLNFVMILMDFGNSFLCSLQLWFRNKISINDRILFIGFRFLKLLTTVYITNNIVVCFVNF